MQSSAFAIVVLLASVVTSSALAWQSGPESPMTGPLEARNVWGWSPGGTEGKTENEHARLLYLAMKRSGFPDRLTHLLGNPVSTNVYVTAGPEIPGVGARYMPAPFSNAPANRMADGTVTRQYTIPGFAALPDHSYSLGDWAAGNEVCPPGTSATSEDDATVCHSFSRLGVVNSLHFLPQAEHTYMRHHQLAMKRADECKALFEQFSRSGAYSFYGSIVREMVQQCEQEALLIEAVGQHFLQDAFAIGHMWERWGYPTFGEYPDSDPKNRLYRAGAASLLAGMIHGSESVTDAPDLMSAGNHVAVAFDPGFLVQGQTPYVGIGDIHVSELLNGAVYSDQRQLLLSCSQAGMQEVYDRTGMTWGARQHPATESIGSVGSCFKQRATNKALELGLYGGCRPGYVPTDPIKVVACSKVPLTFFSKLVLGLAASKSKWPMPDTAQKKILDDRMSREITVIAANARIAAKLDPQGSELARGGMLPEGLAGFLGIPRNGHSTSGIPASYLEADLPWPRSADRLGESWTPDVWISRVFNKAHVQNWCTDPEAAPTALRASVARATNDAQKLTACSICATFVSRHVRNGDVPSICQYAGAANGSIPAPNGMSITTDSLEAVGKRYCGCYIYDVASDFSKTRSVATGPLDVWSYGWWGYDASNLGWHPYLRSQTFGPVDTWNDPGNVTLGAPDVSHNSTFIPVTSVSVDWQSTPVTSVTLYPGEVILHPGQGTVKSGIRFKVPISGSYILQATFAGRDAGGPKGQPPINGGTSTDVQILRNGRPLLTGFVNGFDDKVTYERTLLSGLQEGDFIDFVVGNINGDFTSDSTGLTARLELSPLDTPK